LQKEVKKYPTLAQFVSETREKLGLSQTGLAKRCNLTIDEIANIESGVELFLSSTVRQKLAKGLKTSLGEVKIYEKNEDFHFTNQGKADIDELKNLILENVRNLASHDHGNTMKVIKGALDEFMSCVQK